MTSPANPRMTSTSADFAQLPMSLLQFSPWDPTLGDYKGGSHPLGVPGDDERGLGVLRDQSKEAEVMHPQVGTFIHLMSGW